MTKFTQKKYKFSKRLLRLLRYQRHDQLRKRIHFTTLRSLRGPKRRFRSMQRIFPEGTKQRHHAPKNGRQSLNYAHFAYQFGAPVPFNIVLKNFAASKKRQSQKQGPFAALQKQTMARSRGKRVFPLCFKEAATSLSLHGNPVPSSSSLAFSEGKNGSAAAPKGRPMPSEQPLATCISKRKYVISSYLFHVVCKFPRSYICHFLGHNIFRTYNIIPFRPSVTRFLVGKLLKTHYRHLSSHSLSKLAKSVSVYRAPLTPTYPGVFWSAFGRQVVSRKNEVAKKFIIRLEQRLDSSLFRLLHLKGTKTKKYRFVQRRKKIGPSGSSPKKPLLSQRDNKLVKRFVKIPIDSFSSLHIKQLINHGHVLVNGKKVRSGGKILFLDDQIQYRPRDLCSLDSRHRRALSQSLAPSHELLKNHQSTMLLRHLKDHSYLRLLEGADSSGENTLAQWAFLLNYVQHLKIKRFSDVFFLTYRNLHFIERFVASLPPQRGGKEATTSVVSAPSGAANIEKEIQPLFNSVGYNQSLYFLWPVLSLLHIYRWGSREKYKFLEFSLLKRWRPWHSPWIKNRRRRAEKKKLKSFLHWKRFLSTPPQKNLSAANSDFGFEGATKWPPLQNPGRTSLIDLFLSLRDAHSFGPPKGGATKSSLSPSGSRENRFSHHSVLRNFSAKHFPPLSPIRGQHHIPRSYARILYGTRVSKWVRLQQQGPTFFYNSFHKKSHFFQLELDFFQWIYHAYTPR